MARYAWLEERPEGHFSPTARAILPAGSIATHRLSRRHDTQAALHLSLDGLRAYRRAPRAKVSIQPRVYTFPPAIAFQAWPRMRPPCSRICRSSHHPEQRQPYSPIPHAPGARHLPDPLSGPGREAIPVRMPPFWCHGERFEKTPIRPRAHATSARASGTPSAISTRSR